MKKLLIIFICSLIICWATVAIAWVVGLLTSCAFVDGCYEKLSFVELLGLVDEKSVFVRGTLLSLVFMLFAWSKFRHS